MPPTHNGCPIGAAALTRLRRTHSAVNRPEGHRNGRNSLVRPMLRTTGPISGTG